MLFKKLFRVLVVGSTVVATGAGCAPRAAAQSPSLKAGDARDGGGLQDAGQSAAETGGGVPGW